MRSHIQWKKLAISYLAALIPVLLISFCVSAFTDRLMQQKKSTEAESRVRLALEQMETLNNRERNNATQMAAVNAFSPYTMMNIYNHQPDAAQRQMEALDRLTQLQQFDSSITDIALYYGDGMVYSGKRMTELHNYFKLVLFCNDASTGVAAAAIARDDDSQTLLWCDESDGYLMMHYSNRLNTAYRPNFSVNFLISFRQLGDRLNNLVDPALTGACLIMGDGTAVNFVNSGTRLLSAAAALPDGADINDYTAIVQSSALAGVTLTAYYNTNLLYGELRRSQMINYVLLGVGMLLSALLAYIFSRRRARQLSLLEAMLQTGTDNGAPSRGELAELQNMVRARLRENRHQENKMQTDEIVLRCQTAMLLFHGWVQDEAAAARFLQSCGLMQRTSYYFVGGVLFAAGQEPNAVAHMEQLLANDLCYRAEVSGRTALYFLTEASALDPSQNIRLSLGKQLQEVLQALDVHHAQIGFGTVRASLTETGLAFAEASKTLEQLAAQPGVSCVCWEDLCVPAAPAELLHADTVAAMQNAVRAGSAVQAEAALAQLLREIDTRAAPAQRSFLRAALLLRIADAFPEEQRPAVESAAASVPIDDAVAFERGVRALLAYTPSAEAPRSVFEKITAYLDAHYSESELTAEQTAAFAGITPQYLTRLFKSRTGLSYIDYLTQLRMRTARDLLRTTDLSVQDIVERVGYRDASSFRRKFKALYGMGAHEYRETGGRGNQ